ncbi:universal stress protein [Saliphagus infecundisoli]|uniref:Universal stress protein n=1 Tax=Saliphagus infecundisoli TaxID=1849069 RepID=A0ABD5QL25_9EURY|nr:universal stress protein [Saliphagus infecundisoli]
MYENVLVATDGSAHANNAVDHAIAIASRFDATLHVLSVIDTRDLGVTTPAEIDVDMLRESLREESEIAIDDALSKTDETDLPVVSEIVIGVPSRSIAAYATENDIDLIVIGAKGKSALKRALLGSVTREVLQSSAVPVLTVQLE